MDVVAFKYYHCFELNSVKFLLSSLFFPSLVFALNKTSKQFFKVPDQAFYLHRANSTCHLQMGSFWSTDHSISRLCKVSVGSWAGLLRLSHCPLGGGIQPLFFHWLRVYSVERRAWTHQASFLLYLMVFTASKVSRQEGLREDDRSILGTPYFWVRDLRGVGVCLSSSPASFRSPFVALCPSPCLLCVLPQFSSNWSQTLPRTTKHLPAS